MTSVAIRRAESRDATVTEAWACVTDDEQVAGVSASRSSRSSRSSRGAGDWHVSVSAAEHVRSEPLQSQLHGDITRALTAVPGAVRAEQEDRELWLVAGEVTGEALIRAVATVLNQLAPAIRAAQAPVR